MTSPGHQLCIESASKLFTNRIFERITVFQLQFATFFHFSFVIHVFIFVLER